MLHGRLATPLLVALLAAACATPSARPPVPAPAPTPVVRMPEEVRALWVVRFTLAHPDSVRAMVQRADEAGFNTLIVQVRGRGDAFYDGTWEPRADALADQPADFDPLELVIEEAHRRGIAVHAWVNTHLIANMDQLPKAEDHIVYRRPDLVAVPQPLARELYDADPFAPGYVDRILEYARNNRSHIEGLYTIPSSPEVKEHVYSIWMDVLERYDVDGIHFDYVRYPAPDHDYSRTALDRFRRWLEPQLDDAVRERFSALADADPLAYTDSFPEEWDRFRRAQITDLVERIYHGVKQRKPDVLVSAAVFANSEDAYTRRYQDWREWLRRGILDIAAPMAYSVETSVFEEQIRTAVETAGGERVWAGIGSWRNTVDGTVEKIEVARDLDAAGIVLFSYDAAVRPSENNPDGDFLLRVRDRAFRGALTLRPTPNSLKPQVVAHEQWHATPPLGHVADAMRRNLAPGDTLRFKDLTITLLELAPEPADGASGRGRAVLLLERPGERAREVARGGEAFNWEGFHVAVLAARAAPGQLGSGLAEFEVGTLESLPPHIADATIAGDASYRLRVPHDIDRITLHHSGSPEPLRPEDDPVEKLRGLQSWGASARNWWDVPYHFLIDLDGTIYEGRDHRYMGETNTRYNPRGHLLITVIGNYNIQEATPAQLEAIESLMAWAAVEFDVPRDRIYGHGDHADTSCPGTHLGKYLEDGSLVEGVRERLRALGHTVPVTAVGR